MVWVLECSGGSRAGGAKCDDGYGNLSPTHIHCRPAHPCAPFRRRLLLFSPLFTHHTPSPPPPLAIGPCCFDVARLTRPGCWLLATPAPHMTPSAARTSSGGGSARPRAWQAARGRIGLRARSRSSVARKRRRGTASRQTTSMPRSRGPDSNAPVAARQSARVPSFRTRTQVTALERRPQSPVHGGGRVETSR